MSRLQELALFSLFMASHGLVLSAQDPRVYTLWEPRTTTLWEPRISTIWEQFYTEEGVTSDAGPRELSTTTRIVYTTDVITSDIYVDLPEPSSTTTIIMYTTDVITSDIYVDPEPSLTTTIITYTTDVITSDIWIDPSEPSSTTTMFVYNTDVITSDVYTEVEPPLPSATPSPTPDPGPDRSGHPRFAGAMHRQRYCDKAMYNKVALPPPEAPDINSIQSSDCKEMFEAMREDNMVPPFWFVTPFKILRLVRFRTCEFSIWQKLDTGSFYIGPQDVINIISEAIRLYPGPRMPANLSGEISRCKGLSFDFPVLAAEDGPPPWTEGVAWALRLGDPEGGNARYIRESQKDIWPEYCVTDREPVCMPYM